MNKNDKRINVLHVVTSMNRGGIESLCMNVLRNIDKEKFKVFFLCYGDAEFEHEAEIEALGGEIIRVPDVKSVGVVAHINKLHAVLMDNRIGILHSHVYLNSMFSLIAAKISGVRARIVHSHNTKLERKVSLKRKIYVITAKLAIKTLSTKRVACGESAGRVLFGRSSFEVVHNGIIVDDYRFDDIKRRQVREELGIAGSATAILHAARFEYAKNHKFLIDIFNLYLKTTPDAKLLLAGDGSLKNGIEEYVDNLGINHSVVFLGNRSDMDRLYNAADIFLLPSHHEGLPVTLVEAQMNGLPCVVSTGVPAEADVSGNMQFISLDDDISAWIDIMRRAERNNSQVREGVYNIKTTVNRLEAIYKELIENTEEA